MADNRTYKDEYPATGNDSRKYTDYYISIDEYNKLKDENERLKKELDILKTLSNSGFQWWY